MTAVQRPPVWTLGPAALVAWFIIESYNQSQMPLSVAWRPLLVGIGLVVALQWVMSRLLRDPHSGAFLAASAVLAVLQLNPPAVGAAAIGLGLFALAYATRRRADLSPRLAAVPRVASSGLGVYALALVAVVVWDGIGIGSIGLPRAHGFDATASPVSPGISATPDIYLVLLDGYPRADWLAGAFEYDNTPFLDDLAERGFEVAERSHSNYAATQLTLVSMMEMQYIQTIDGLQPAPQPVSRQYRALSGAFNDAAALGELRSRGYRIATTISAITDTALESADLYLDGGQINYFEDSIFRHTILAQLIERVAPGWVGAQQRDRINANFEHLKAVAGDDSSQPTFMLAHILQPHTPHVFGPNGEPRRPPACYPRTCQLWEGIRHYLGLEHEEYAAGLTGQIEYANRRVLDAIDTIAATSPDAVIILFSDHGTRWNLAFPDEWYQTLFAARTPGRTGVFPDDVAPVNILSGLLNAYFETDFPLHDYAAWRSVDGILNLEPFIEGGAE